MRPIEVLSVSAGPGPVLGSVPVPSDEGVALARLAASLLSRGESRLKLREMGAQVGSFLAMLGVLGIATEWNGDELVLRGLGLTALPEYEEGLCLDLRGEVMVAGLALGLLTARKRSITILCDDAVLSTLGARLEHMGLARMVSSGEGAGLELGATKERAPGFDAELTGLFPWEKQALLLLALRASSPSRIIEGVLSADHLERALFRSRAPIHAESTLLEIHPPRDDDALAPASYEFIGSHFVGGHLLLLPLLSPFGGEVTVREMAANRSAVELPTILKLLGADVLVAPRGDRQGEPIADVTVRAQGPLRGGVSLAGEQTARLLDLSLPLLSALARAPRASFVTEILCAQRDGSPNVVPRAAAFIAASGLSIQRNETGVSVGGGDGRTRGLRVTTGGDRRLALLGALLGSVGPEESAIDDVHCLSGVFPRCAGTFRRLGIAARVRAAES